MIRLPRLTLSLFALGFGLYVSSLGLMSFASYQDQVFAAIGIAGYVLALLIAVIWKPGLRLNPLAASAVFVIGIVLPLVMEAAIGVNPPSGYSTWHIGGVSVLMAILMVRQHPVLAWAGLAFALTETLVWGGPQIIFSAGIVGAVLLVLAAQAASLLLKSAADSAAQALEVALRIDADSQAQTAARLERQKRLAETLNGVMPILEEIASSQGQLSPSQQRIAVETEQELRDQIRGRSLAIEPLVSAVRSARRSGIEVQLLDDGGLDDMDSIEIQSLLDRTVGELSTVKSGRVVIRSVAGEAWKISVVALRKDQDQPDLFVRI